MMANRILILIIGLLLGIIIGGGTFWYLTGSTGKNIFIVNQKSHNEKARQQKGDQGLNKPKPSDKNPKLEQILPSGTTLRYDSVINESLVDPEVGKINLLERDSLLLAIHKDTFHLRGEQENIIVKKDEMVGMRFLSMINLDHKTEEIQGKKDSLLSAISGIKDHSSSNITLEFWKSPINYRGYKMNRNKLVLFGIQAMDDIQIFKLKDNFYFKNGEKVYRIDKITDFRPFDVVNDSNILNQLH